MNNNTKKDIASNLITKITAVRKFFLENQKLTDLFDLTLNSIINNLNFFIISKNSYISNFFQQIENSLLNFKIFNYQFSFDSTINDLYGNSKKQIGFISTSDLLLLSCCCDLSDDTYKNLLSVIETNYHNKAHATIFSISNKRLIKNNLIWKKANLKFENNFDFYTIELFKKVENNYKICKNDIVLINQLIDQEIIFTTQHHKILFSINNLLINYNKKIKSHNDKIDLITNDNVNTLIKIIKTDAFIKNKTFINENNFYIIKNFLSHNFIHFNVLDYLIKDFFNSPKKHYQTNIIEKFMLARKHDQSNVVYFLNKLNLLLEQKQKNKQFPKRKFILFNNFYYLFSANNKQKIYLESKYFDNFFSDHKNSFKTNIVCWDNTFNKIVMNAILDQNTITDLTNNVQYFASFSNNEKKQIFLENNDKNKIIQIARFILKSSLSLYEQLNILLKDTITDQFKDYSKIAYDYDTIRKINSLLINFINFLLNNNEFTISEIIEKIRTLRKQYAI